MQNIALDLTDANKILLFVIIKITSASHIFKLWLFHHVHKMKVINFTKLQMALIC